MLLKRMDTGNECKRGKGVEFFVLGSVRASIDGSDVFLGGTKQRTVLVSLLLHDDHVLSNERLTHLLWDSSPPSTASAQIHTYMSRLRIRLSPRVAIIREHQGYRLHASDAWMDWKEFSRLVELAHAELDMSRFEQAALHFHAALELCRGPVLSDVTPFLADQAGPAWEELRMSAVEGRIWAELRLGMHASLVPELTQMVREYPYREVLRAQLMAALYFSSRQADALAVYQNGRRILAEEMGVDPGRTLVRTYIAVLKGALSLDGLLHIDDPITA